MYKINFRIIQFLLWLLTYLAIFFYCYYKFDNLGLSVVYSVLVTLVYVATVYGNSDFFDPTLL